MEGEARTTVEGAAARWRRAPIALAGAARALRAAPEAIGRRADGPYAAVDAVVRDRLVRELHDYPRKHLLVARLVWLATGFVGGHRYYLGHVGLGLLMTGTVGGAFAWWIADGFRLRALVDGYNAEQAARERDDRPPLGMEFVPKVAPDVLGEPPAWAPGGRPFSHKLMGLFADALVVMCCSFLLASVTEDLGAEPTIWAVVAMVVTINAADWLLPFYHLPGVRQMVRWDYRLRLFYHFNPPGRFYTLLLRPVAAFCYAPFSRRARAEAQLYAEIGGLFVAAATVYRLFSGDLFAEVAAFDASDAVEGWVGGVIVEFFTIYAFAMPIGATLMKHVLLRRPNGVRWTLSVVAVYYLLVGLEWL